MTGTVENNRIDKNDVGIVATTRLIIFDNEMMFNSDAAILVDGTHDIRIAGNIIRSATGDAIRLVDGAYNVEVTSNILWVDDGYDLNVADDSQTGFWSDYNTLYAGPAGKLVYWTKDFTDILDWQDDVARFDLHSDGTTIVDPNRAEPHLAETADGFFSVMPLEAGQRDSDLAAGNGDPAGAFIFYKGAANLLADGDFESGLAGWTVTTGGYTTATGPVAYSGSSVFQSGPAANAVAQQSIDLVGAGYSRRPSSIPDRCRSPSAAGSSCRAVRGQCADLARLPRCQWQFHRARRPSSRPAPTSAAICASSTPSMCRPARAPRNTSSPPSTAGVAQGATLDAAYLAVLPRGVDADQGQGPAAANPAPPQVPEQDGRLEITSPDLYTDWELDTPHLITWNSYGGAAGGAVRIELWQDGPSGPALRAVISASTADTGRFDWVPSDSGLTYGTQGLRIRIERVADPAVFDMSAEPFAIPENGSNYYVNDGSLVGDDPALGITAVGSNRNTGKTPDAPKPNPVNVFRTYDVGAGATVYVDTGDYPLIDTLQVSGSVDRGLGLDSGFTIQGPTDGAAATLHAAIPGDVEPALIDVLDADFVTINDLKLVGGTVGLDVHGGSDDFSASYLTATGQSADGFDIATNSPNGVLDHLTADDESGVGLRFSGTLKEITYLNASRDAEGLVVTGSVGEISFDTLIGNRGWGLDLTLTGASVIQENTITGNGGGGALIEGDDILFGDANLSAGLGNVVTGNGNIGVYANGNIDVVGNIVTGNIAATGIFLRNAGARAENNYVGGNETGIDDESGTTLTGNRVFDNTGTGLQISGNGGESVRDNVVYSNAIGVNVTTNGVTLSNNLVYGDSQIGLWLEADTTVLNNTIYEPTAGNGTDPGTGFGTAAVVIQRQITVSFENNIVVALAGIGIRVADAAQAGFSSNYNLFSTGVGGRIGNWLGVDRATLAAWRVATGRDKNSQSGDPAFVDVDGADNVLGYASATQDGSDDDFHVQTPDGTFAGGSLAVVLDATTGKLSLPGGVLTTTFQSRSPAIDAGDPSTPVGAETAPNGKIVEVGAYGGTAQASRSPTTFLNITAPNGGETLFEGLTTNVTWTSFNVTGTVTLSASADGTTFTTIARGIADDGSYAWTLDPALFPPAKTYVIKIQSDQMPSVSDLSNGTFIISAPVHAYYVNADATGGDVTTAGGSDDNSGLDAADPLASLGALLTKYTLKAGDTVYLDAGTYNLTRNVVFDATQSGTAANPIEIIGDGDKTVFDRGSNADGFYDIEIDGASDITFQDIRLQGAQWQFYVDANSNSTGVALTNVTADVPTNSSGIYVGAGNGGFSIDASQVVGSGNGYGLLLDNDNGASVTKSTFSDLGTGVQLNGTTGTTLRGDMFADDNYAVYTSGSLNVTFDGLTASGGYYGIQIQASGVIENSTIHDTDAFGLGVGGFYDYTLTAQGNTVYNVGGGNAYAAALDVNNGATAINNIVYDSYNGIDVSALAEGNTVYGIQNIGVIVEFNGTARGNDIHDNAIGLLFTSNNGVVANNVVVDNAIGIQANRYSNGINNFTIVNNTIVQALGVGFTAVGNPYNYNVRDNIFDVAAGAVAISMPASAENGFSSDYNLFDIAAGGTLAMWSGQSYDLTGWQLIFGFDKHGLSGDPRFTNAAGGDFTLQAGSPALDRGDPSLPFNNEPSPNGGRIDIGAYGDTAQAGPSPAKVVQIVTPIAQARAALGDQLTLTFQTSGIADTGGYELASGTPVLLMNAGGPALTGAAGTFVASSYSTKRDGTDVNDSSVPFESLIADPNQPPEALFKTYDFSYQGIGNTLSYQVPVADGTYALTLYFATRGNSSPGQNLFDIHVNGQVPTAALLNDDKEIAATGIDPYQLAGDRDDTAISVTVLATATGGKGLSLDLYNESTIYGPFLNGLAVAAAPVPVAKTATVSVSTDGGKTFSTIGTNVPLDSFGDGAFTWTVDRTGSAQFRVTVDGVNSTPAQDGHVLLVPAGHDYYVDPAGSDDDTGKSADHAMADLSALINAYQLEPGDTVHLASGTYALPAAITLGSDVSGTSSAPITFVGAGASTVLARAGTVDGTAALAINGAHDLVFSNLDITGGSDAVTIAGGSDISFDKVGISAFGGGSGLYADSASSNIALTNSSITNIGGTGRGFVVSGETGATVSNDSFSGLIDGVNAYYGANLAVTGSTFSNNSGSGIYAFDTNNLLVSGNVVTSGGSAGINVYGGDQVGAIIDNNKVSGVSGNVGILVSNRTTATGNEVFGNRYGLQVNAGATAIGTIAHDNVYGVIDGGNAGPVSISGSIIYDNQYGTDFSYTVVTFANNLLYGNVIAGIYSDSFPNATIVNNTVVQSGGIAIDLTEGNGVAVTLQNNIVDASAGAQALNVVLSAEPNFSSDWNDIHLASGATFGTWGGIAVATLDDWRFQTTFDQDSTDADPGFVDPANADYHLAAGSAAIDRGNPLSTFDAEPGNNGGRVNLGSDGDTPAATQSPAQTVQVLSPNGLEKLEVGVPTTITFRSSGLAAENPVIAINTGGNAVVGATASANYVQDTQGPNNGATSEGAAVDTTGVSFAAPAAVYSESKTAAGGVGNTLTQTVAVNDGTYTVRLDFAEYYDKLRYGYARQFSIAINGVVVDPLFDIYAAAGNEINKAVVETYTAQAAGGKGLTITLTNLTSAPASLAGIEISQANAAPVSTAKVEASYDNGATWQTIDDAAPVDAFGSGSLAWTPTEQTGAALVRVTMGSGAAAVSDTSDAPFLVTNAGHDYYVNDGSTTGDEYTSAVGDELNSGKTPDAPVASVQTLLNAYHLGAGDIVHVDTGTYVLLQDLAFTADDGGTGDAAGQRLTIQGATEVGDVTLFNRANPGEDSAAFTFAGGNDITVENVTLTGGYSGVRLHYGSTSQGISIVDDVIHDNTNDGIQVESGNGNDYDFLVQGSKIYNQGNSAAEFDSVLGVTILDNELFSNRNGVIESGGSKTLIESNIVHDNREEGIYATDDSRKGTLGSLVTDNQVLNNGMNDGYSPFGIEIEGQYAVASDNDVTGQTGGSNVGIRVNSGATVSNNTISGNQVGVYAVDGGTIVSNNRIFENAADGVLLGFYGPVEVTANRIYSNLLGIGTTGLANYTQALINDNLIYVNADGGIDLSGGANHVIAGNTVYQSTETVIDLEGSETNVTLEDNIIWGDLGTLVSVSPGVSGLIANYNLYYRGANNAANVAVVGATTYATLADWQAGDPTNNVKSRSGNPNFITATGAGADHVLGGPDTALGGGADDDFTPGKGSLAIDAADDDVLPATDLLGQSRHDDPATPDAGSGKILSIGGYAPQSTGMDDYAFSGDAILHGWSGAADYPLTYNLPFDFTYFGQTVSSVRLSSAGYIELDPTASFADAGSPSVAALATGLKIAPFWSTVDAVTGADNVYADASVAGQVKFTWVVRPTGGTASATSQFSATLFADGHVQFDYGGNLDGLTPVIGVSDGSALSSVLAPNSGRTDLSDTASIVFTPQQVRTLSYADIGAFEFQGSTSDVTPPTLVSGTNLPAAGASTDAVFTTISLTFSEALDVTSAASAANFKLAEADSAGMFDTTGSTLVPLTVSYDATSRTVTLTLAQPLADGLYRLTVSGGNGLLDSAGNPLDGDGNGTAGGAYQRVFTVDRSANHPPVANEVDVTAAGATAQVVTLSATDPDDNTLTYSIIAGPKHGTISDFDALRGTFTYTSVDGFAGSDTIRYAVDDGFLGHAEADVVVTGRRTQHEARRLAGERRRDRRPGADDHVAAGIRRRNAVAGSDARHRQRADARHPSGDRAGHARLHRPARDERRGPVFLRLARRGNRQRNECADERSGPGLDHRHEQQSCADRGRRPLQHQRGEPPDNRRRRVARERHRSRRGRRADRQVGRECLGWHGDL